MSMNRALITTRTDPGYARIGARGVAAVNPMSTPMREPTGTEAGRTRRIGDAAYALVVAVLASLTDRARSQTRQPGVARGDGTGVCRLHPGRHRW